MKIAVIGAAGYAGGELLRLLLAHPEVRHLRAVSRSSAGKSFGEVHPALIGYTDLRFEAGAPASVAAESDVTFLALEHGASTEIAAELCAATRGLVIDLADDFRLSARQPIGTAPFRYALADVAGSALRGERFLAVPGCFATAASLAMLPLSQIAPRTSAALFAITGSSGAGAQAKDTTHHPRRASNVQAYAPLAHRHQAEIDEQWARWTGGAAPAPRLLTHLGPFVRGILLTLHARGSFDVDGAEVVARAFSDRPFVRCASVPPALNHVVGTNLALIFAHTSPARDELMISIAIDNLIKGAAGQAVQAMNLALGIDEQAGLRLAGVFPC
jgi:N-acetyl-gamma-glutamyl-phosphate reductase